MNKIICSNCRNNHTSNPIAGGLGTVFCFDCSTETEVKTGKKVFASRIHPTNPYNFSEDELFLILSLGSIILEVAEKPKKIDKIYEYLKWRDPNTKEGIGLEKEKIKIIKKRLKEGYSVAIEISKKMTEDEGSNLFNILFQILINQKDVTINETAALVEICRLTEGNWQSFMVFLSENSPFKIAEIGPAMKNINIPIENIINKQNKSTMTNSNDNKKPNIEYNTSMPTITKEKSKEIIKDDHKKETASDTKTKPQVAISATKDDNTESIVKKIVSQDSPIAVYGMFKITHPNFIVAVNFTLQIHHPEVWLVIRKAYYPTFIDKIKKFFGI